MTAIFGALAVIMAVLSALCWWDWYTMSRSQRIYRHIAKEAAWAYGLVALVCAIPAALPLVTK